MPQWLNRIGDPFSDCAAVFELITLEQIRGANANPITARQAELRARNAGEVNDLCELVALISLTPAAGTPADVRLNELAAAWSLRELQFA
ncbi:hypothetical protein ABTM02_20005, partial [Acinetobacter baumannii]